MDRRFFVLKMVLLVALIPSWAAAAPEPSQADGEQKPLVQLMSQKRESRLRSLLPKVEDEKIQKLLEDPQLILYTDQEMPRAYQFWDGMQPGVHLASYNISANGSEPFGNGNREFPWAVPAGTHRTDNVWSFRFIHLPTDEQGQTLPIVWFRTRSKVDSQMGYGWRFPVGAVVGEVLMMRDSDGEAYCFELRVREREQDDWNVDVFRPFPHAKDLVERIQELRPDWAEQSNLKSFVDLLSSPAELPIRELADQHPRRTIRQKAGVYLLPSLEDDALVRELLTQTLFKSAANEYWFEGVNGELAAAPTTKAPFHIVPAKYDAGFVEVDRVSCVRCHETVNHSVDRFQPGRDWYGRIRGSDGIFSFHPFDPGCISNNGYSRPVQMRKDLTRAGVIAKYDRKQHDELRYAQVPHLVE